MSGNSENAVLGFVVGAIVVAALVFVFVLAPRGGDRGGGVDVTIESPAPANPG
jgi:hypothetical protein